MKVEIIFQSSGEKKTCLGVEAVYTKGLLLCFQYTGGLIVAHPEGRIFSIAYQHQPHLGTTRKPASRKAAAKTRKQHKT